MKIKSLNFFRQAAGFTIAEILVALAVTSVMVSLSVTPILQMKTLENRVASQSSLDLAHQLALQKARNADFLRSKLGLQAGNALDNCFGGRGTSCSSYSRTQTLEPSPSSDQGQHLNPSDSPIGSASNSSSKPSSSSAPVSTITATVQCDAIKCHEVQITVSTSASANARALASNWTLRPLISSFGVPAMALSSRREIDFSKCTGKAITGVDFNTLTALCDGFSGNNTCSGIANAGPMATFGQPSSAANCQPPVNTNCGTGMASFGMINGQAKCATVIKCTDPLSTACQPAGGGGGAAKPCTPNWQPLASNVCAGTPFTQTDANNCAGSVPTKATGTNAGVCAMKACNFKGTIKWPDAMLGPCEATATLSVASGLKTSTLNQKAGYYGSFSPTCTSSGFFDLANAISDCSPVVCSGIASTLSWSNKGLKSATSGPNLDTTGPWECSGAVSLSASPAGAGTLVNTLANPASKGTATNTAATAMAGSVTLTCTDPGPTTVARMGVLNVTAANCVPAPPKPLITLPVRGQHCDIGGPWGWRWHGSQLCPVGAAMVSNQTVACPPGATQYGQGCYTPNSSALGKQLCPGADQADECCFYPCQDGGVQPPVNCTEALPGWGVFSGFAGGGSNACWGSTSPIGVVDGMPFTEGQWLIQVIAQCKFLDTTWTLQRDQWSRVLNGFSATQLYRPDANVTYGTPACFVSGCKNMGYDWNGDRACVSDQILTCRAKDGETYTEIRKVPISYPQSLTYGICATPGGG